jgi:mRNA-degrading endonuclease toxin of MazEF toxin-antitoxin module
MKLRLGEVVLVRMQFHQVSGAKGRPAVVVFDSGDDDFIAAPITSQLRRSEFDLAIGDWQATGLNVVSSFRIQKLTILAKAEIARNLGSLSDHDWVCSFNICAGGFARE